MRGGEEKCPESYIPGCDSHQCLLAHPSATLFGNTGRLEGREVGECLRPGWVASGKTIFPGEWALAKRNDRSAFHKDYFPTPAASAVRESGGDPGGKITKLRSLPLD